MHKHFDLRRKPLNMQKHFDLRRKLTRSFRQNNKLVFANDLLPFCLFHPEISVNSSIAKNCSDSKSLTDNSSFYLSKNSLGLPLKCHTMHKLGDSNVLKNKMRNPAELKCCKMSCSKRVLYQIKLNLPKDNWLFLI